MTEPWFLAAYDSFYHRWALDGHEGGDVVLAEFARRIEVHRKVWEHVVCHITSEQHASNSAHHDAGFIGEREAQRRLWAIAREGGFPGAEQPC